MAYIPNPNQSVSGTVGASIIGLPPVGLNVGGNPVSASNPVAIMPPASGHLDVEVISSVGSRLQSTNASVITVNQGSIAAVIIGGSIAASFTPPANQSVSGAVSVSNFPANQSVSGAVSVSNFPTTQNVSGSVTAWLQSTNASVITVGSPVANQSVSGTVSVGNFPTTQNISGSVFATGSVTALQGTNPWIITGSVQASLTPAANSSSTSFIRMRMPRIQGRPPH